MMISHRVPSCEAIDFEREIQENVATAIWLLSDMTRQYPSNASGIGLSTGLLAKRAAYGAAVPRICMVYSSVSREQYSKRRGREPSRCYS